MYHDLLEGNHLVTCFDFFAIVTADGQSHEIPSQVEHRRLQPESPAVRADLSLEKS